MIRFMFLVILLCATIAFVITGIELGLDLLLIPDYTVVKVVDINSSENNFGFAIKTDTGKFIQIYGCKEALEMAIEKDKILSVPESNSAVYSVNVEDIIL
ncbi:MAG: hypothetical protein ACFFG0_08215 [Candidatus Thorarchaeota archaeon]